MTKKNIPVLVCSIILIVVGILFACAVVDTNIINIMTGVCFLLAGVTLFTLAAINKFKLLSINGVIGAACIAFGTLLLVNKGFVGMMTYYILIALMVFGIVFILDSIYGLLQKRNAILEIIKLVIGVGLFVCGITFYLVNDATVYIWLVLGICIAIIGAYLMLSLFIKEKN